MANWRERILERAEAARNRASDIDFDKISLDRVNLAQLRREEEADSAGFLSGFGLGVVVGALLALIFAPWKGDQTREIVADRAIQLKDKATDLVAQVRGDVVDEEIAPALEFEVDDVIAASEDRY